MDKGGGLAKKRRRNWGAKMIQMGATDKGNGNGQTGGRREMAGQPDWWLAASAAGRTDERRWNEPSPPPSVPPSPKMIFDHFWTDGLCGVVGNRVSERNGTDEEEEGAWRRGSVRQFKKTQQFRLSFTLLGWEYRQSLSGPILSFFFFSRCSRS